MNRVPLLPAKSNPLPIHNEKRQIIITIAKSAEVKFQKFNILGLGVLFADLWLMRPGYSAGWFNKRIFPG